MRFNRKVLLIDELCVAGSNILGGYLNRGNLNVNHCINILGIILTEQNWKVLQEVVINPPKFCKSNQCIYHSKKFQVQLRNEKYLEKGYNYGIKRKLSKKKSDDDNGGISPTKYSTISGLSLIHI